MYAIENMIWGHGNEGDFMILEQPGNGQVNLYQIRYA